MKNKIFLSIAIAAITAVAAVNVSIGLNSQKEELSALEMANVEALANGEGSVRVPCESEKGKSCSFNIVTPSGQQGSATLLDMKPGGGVYV